MDGLESNVVDMDGIPVPVHDASYIDQVFGATGYLAKMIPGYRPRDGQIKLARAIDRGIHTGHHVIGEGPTGTGKSLAYSVPAAYHAVTYGRRVCIVTANKNLQRQIYQKDLADLAKAVPWKFTYAIRKGHNSYLCLRNWDQGDWETVDSQYSDIAEATDEWARRTTTGDYEESPGAPPKVWAAFSTSREDCDGRKCAYIDDCFAKRARDRAQGAQIIVTNYHLFFLHLKMGPDSKVLPAFDVVIMDEAHRAANIAREFFGQEVTYGSLYRCVNAMHMVDIRGFKGRGQDLRDKIMKSVSSLWSTLAYRARKRNHILSQQDPIDSQDLEGLLRQASEFYREAAIALGANPESPQAGGGRRKGPPGNAETGATYLKLSERCLARADLLGEFRVVANEHTTYFIEGSGQEEKGKYVKLKSKAIEVGWHMRFNLFQRFPTVVQTSATLAVRGGKGSAFAYLRREMGMNSMRDQPELEVEELVVESPFDWPKQAMLVIPRSMPEPQKDNEAWDLAVCQHLEETVNVVRGRTLGLFTSFRMLEKAKEHLRANTRWRVLAQGEGTNRELMEQFQKDVNSVLLGTESFAEGVSIEGEACSCVVLDKIPFPNPDDPIVMALDHRLKQRGGREHVFQTYMLPEAIISFKQRIGRLIRTVKDVGVVVVLDKRLLTKSYRMQFLKSIPPLRQREAIEDIGPFLREVGAL